MNGKSLRISDQKDLFTSVFANIPLPIPCQKNLQYANAICLCIWLLIGFHRIICYITSDCVPFWLSVCPPLPKLHGVVTSGYAPAQDMCVYIHSIHLTHTETGKISIQQTYTSPLSHMCVSFCTEQTQMFASSESKGTLQESGNQGG